MHWTTGWRRCIGCLKLQVIFRKRATNYRALLREMTCEDKASYKSSPPCRFNTLQITGLTVCGYFKGTSYVRAYVGGVDYDSSS